MDSVRLFLGVLVLFAEVTGALSSSSLYCGQRYLTARDDVRILTSPGYPNNYENDMNCTWIITADSDTAVVHVQVIRSSTEYFNGCRRNDRAIAYDGPHLQSTIITRWCGSQTPTFRSTDRYLTLNFLTDGSVVDSGFNLTYRQGREGSDACGGQLTGSSWNQYFTSPKYPNDYRNNERCVWFISASADNNLKLTATDTDIETSPSSHCTYDSIKVYDGHIKEEHLLGTFCGSERPTFVSSGSNMTVVFKTDGNIVGRGFSLSYQSGQFNGSQICASASLTADRKTRYISSPGYPHNYSKNLDCKRTIIASIGYNIKLVVTFSDLETSSTCLYDFVKIFDGSSITGHLLAKFCGNETPTVVSSSNRVLVQFKTDETNVGKGFRMSYQSGHFNDTRNCVVSTLTASNYVKYFSSPGYPQHYANNLNCKWILSTTYGYNIKLIVTDADIESYPGCIYDSVKVYDGSSTYSTLIDKFCGTQKPTFVSSGIYMTVVFETDGSTVAKGFRMSFQSGHFDSVATCGQRELTSLTTTHEIKSPFYPSLYPNNADCIWIIHTGNYDFVVYMIVTYLDIEDRIGCSSDYLQAVDGQYSYGSSLGKWCGTEIPAAQYSTGQYMHIEFHSDDSSRSTGFSLDYYSTSSSSRFQYNKSPASGVIIGGIAAGCIIIIGISCFIAYRTRRHGPRARRPGQNRQRRTSRRCPQEQMVYTIGDRCTATDMPPASYVPPPSYNEVMAIDQAHQADAPPPYNSLSCLPAITSSITGNSRADGDKVETDDDVENDVSGPDTYVPDTHPIIQRENAIRGTETCQGQDNRAGPSDES